jgi:hypothetical protein
MLGPGFLEYFWGHHGMGHVHLNHGLTLLCERKDRRGITQTESFLDGLDDPADVWILEIFFRFQVSANLA